ncbi:hypothetical protein C5167_005923 [Papaver somniferum]|uniref:Uncharacterized protein n=1 Tax=Papaver somniferum TaxID=3469 RepID=A0A4Y7JBZ1_PAPSO|nr:hypothetical protein C5167_005923 [Papaver somniferum]
MYDRAVVPIVNEVLEGFNQRRPCSANSRDDVPEKVEGKKVIALDMGLLVARTKNRGEFEE